MYTCPMDPDVISKTPGNCPKCGMDLVKQDQTKNTSAEKNSYIPLIVIIGVIILSSLALTYRDFINDGINLTKFISYFMTGFFLTFAAFKLMDLKGFAEGYATYDLFAVKFKPYAYLYPFLELFFGLSMIVGWRMILVLKLEVLVMTFSGLGVFWKLLKKEKFQCACLGTFLKVPLTYVTLVEDFGMAALALLLLLNY